MTYAFLKQAHIALALCSFLGFLVRAAWMASESVWMRHRLTRVLPHLVDTLLLTTAIGMLWYLSPHIPAWLFVKIPGILVYIVLGSLALKRAPTKRLRILSCIAASVTFVWIASVALTKTAWGFWGALGIG